MQRSDEFDTLACTRDLTSATREAFMEEHQKEIERYRLPMFTVGAATQTRYVPLIQRRGFSALCKYDPHNDMQVECRRANLPFERSTSLGIVQGHHWDIAYPAFVKRKWFNNMYHGFPKTAAVVAMVQLAAELGLID